jgi:hypothetical protein
MHQQLWGYRVEEKLYLGVREQKRLNTTGLKDQWTSCPRIVIYMLSGEAKHTALQRPHLMNT